MISIYQQPLISQPNLTGLPIKFRLHSDNVMEHDGGYAEFSYEIFDCFPTAGQKLRISFLNYFFEFTTADSPNACNNEISNSIPGTNEALIWAQTVATQLNANPIISQYWVVSGDGSTTVAFLIFISKEMTGNLVMPALVNATGYLNQLLGTNNPGVTPTRKPSFYVSVDVINHNNDVISNMMLSPDNNMNVEFDLSKELVGQLEPAIYLGSNYHTTAYELIKFFKVRYYERWDNVGSCPSALSHTYYIMYGGIGHLNRGLFFDHATNWYDDLNASKLFLSSRKTQSYIKLSQYLVFGFFYQTTKHNEQVVFRFFKKNGFINEIVSSVGGVGALTIKKYNLTSAISNMIYTMQTTNPGQTIERIEMYVAQAQTPVYFFYVLDELNDGVEFIYRNNWGLYDSIICLGKEELTTQFTQVKEFNKILPQNFHTYTRAIQTSKSEQREYYSISTGLFQADDKTMYSEMLMSDDVFVVKNGIKIPIIIDKSTIKLLNSQDKQSEFKFKYSFAYEESYATDLQYTNIL